MIEMVSYYLTDILPHAIVYSVITIVLLISFVAALAIAGRAPTTSILRFERWLMSPFTVWEFLYLSALYLLFEIADLTLGVMAAFGVPQVSDIQIYFFSGGDIFAILALLIAVAIEELIFRVVPLLISVRFWGFGLPTFACLIGSSIVFGWMHGDIRNVFIQGAGGLFFGMFFLKLSYGGKRPVQAAAFVIALHFAFDMFIIILTGTF